MFAVAFAVFLSLFVATGPVREAHATTALGQRIADIVDAEVGATESPRGSNLVPNKAYGTLGAAWCAHFVTWALRRAGVEPSDSGRGSFNSNVARAWSISGRINGYGRYGTAHDAQVGDLLIDRYDGTPNGGGHISIVVATDVGGASNFVETVGGNESDAVRRQVKDLNTNSRYLVTIAEIKNGTAVTDGPDTSPSTASPYETYEDNRGPAVVSPEEGTLNIFYRDDNDNLAGRSYTSGVGWSTMGTIGAPAGEKLYWDPDATAWGADSVHVVTRTASGKLYERSWSRASGWGSWNLVASSGVTSSPAIVSRYDGHFDVYWRNSSNGLRHRSYTTTSGWSAEMDVPGVSSVGSGPTAASMNSDRQDITYRGSDGKLRNIGWASSSGWGTPLVIPGQPSGMTLANYDPGSTSPADGTLNIYATLANGGLVKVTYNKSSATPWDWQDLTTVANAAGLTSAPDADAWSSTHTDVSAGVDGDLHRTSWAPEAGWATWVAVP